MKIINATGNLIEGFSPASEELDEAIRKGRMEIRPGRGKDLEVALEVAAHRVGIATLPERETAARLLLEWDPLPEGAPGMGVAASMVAPDRLRMEVGVLLEEHPVLLLALAKELYRLGVQPLVLPPGPLEEGITAADLIPIRP